MHLYRQIGYAIMKYFGEPKFRKEYEEQVTTPIGVPCMHCDEPIAEGDTGTMAITTGASSGLLRPLHYECGLRGIIGSVGHQKGLCSCFGGTEEDPEGMTRRQAAVAAARYFHLHN